MPLLRIIFDSNLKAWSEQDFAQIAKHWFDPPPDCTSLFETFTSREETEAAAAFSLTNLSKGIQNGFALRIEHADLEAVGIEISNKRFGSTGVVAADSRHWELDSNKGLILKLIEHIWNSLEEGEDRFRWLSRPAQAAAMRRFCNLGHHLVIAEAKRSCEMKLGDQRRSGRRTNATQIRGELKMHPPIFPDTRIAAAAGDLWIDRVMEGRDGDHLQDWYSAIDQMRQAYEADLLGTHVPSAGI